MSQITSANHRQLAPDELAARLGGWSAGRGPLYRQLAAGLDALVRTGVVRDGERLPPERSLASVLAVSRGTVVSAYELLRAEGTVERRQGSGTTVTRGSRAAAAPAVPTVGDPLFAATPATIDLLKAVPPATPAMRRLAAELDLDAPDDVLESSEPAGIAPLRAAIAERCTALGLPTTPDEILVTTGAQQAVALVVQLLVSRGDVVVSEGTTWPGFADTVRRVGGRIHGVAMDADGVDVDELRAAVDRLRPAMIGLNPHHHNPTGSRLAPVRRVAVADVAADFGVPLVEDRVAAPLAFDGVVPPPLAVHRPDGTSILIDSVSKVAWGGLRIGWIRADAGTIQLLRTAKALADLWSPIPSQLLAVSVLAHVDALTRDRVAELRRRERVLADALSRRLPDWTTPRVRGGMVAWARLPTGSASAFCRYATRYGVAVAGGREFSTSIADDSHVRIPFTLPEQVLVDAVDRLAAAWESFPHHRLDDAMGHRAVV